jgi:hypothetical protein
MMNIDLQTVQQLDVAMRPGGSNRDCVLFAKPLAPSAPALDDLILLRVGLRGFKTLKSQHRRHKCILVGMKSVK